MLKYQRLVRPAVEAHSLVIPVTFGCSHAKCVFCAVNHGNPFRVRNLAEIKRDIDEMATSGYTFERVFLADGDALVIRHERLVQVLDYICEKLPDVQRVGVYGSVKDILRRTPSQLKELRDRKLGIIYLGLESGDDAILEFIGKGSTAAQLLEAGKRVLEAGIILSVTLILGMGGKDRWREHITTTAHLLNELHPHSIRVHTLVVSPYAPLYKLVQEGKFEVPEAFQTLEELKLLISSIELWNTPFLANMRSNYLPLWGLLANEREPMLAKIESVLTSRDYSLLRPESERTV